MQFCLALNGTCLLITSFAFSLAEAGGGELFPHAVREHWWDGRQQDRISALTGGAPQSYLPFLCCRDTVRRQLSVKWVLITH